MAARAAARAAGSAAPRTDDRQGAARPVECGRCGATVEIVKFSPQHTSAQWTAAAVRRCAEFRTRAAEGTRSALVDGCSALRDSVTAAVAAGRLAVSPPAYERAPTRATANEREQRSARLLPAAGRGGDPRDRRRVLVRA